MFLDRFQRSVSTCIARLAHTKTDNLREASTPVVIVVVALITTTDILLITPTLSAMATAFGVPETRVSLVVTVYAIPSIVMAPAVGYLADRLGRRRVLTTCLFLYGSAGTLITVAPTFQVVLLFRAVQGLAAGSILSSLALTLVGDYFEGTAHDSMMGKTAAAISVGAAIYPTVGGYLSTESWRLPFAFYSVAIPIGVAVFGILEDPPAGKRVQSNYLSAALGELQLRKIAGVFALLAAEFLVMFGGVYVALPLFLQVEAGFTAVEVGYASTLLLAATAVTSTQSGRLREVLTDRGRLTVGFGVLGVGIIAFGTTTWVPVLGAALLSAGVGLGIVTPTLFSHISELATEEFRAGVMSLRTSTVGITQAVGPAVFIRLGHQTGYRSVFVAAGMLTVGLGILTYLTPAADTPTTDS